MTGAYGITTRRHLERVSSLKEGIIHSYQYAENIHWQRAGDPPDPHSAPREGEGGDRTNSKENGGGSSYFLFSAGLKVTCPYLALGFGAALCV